MKGLDSAVTQPLGQQNTYERWPYLKIRTLTPTSHFSRNNHRGHASLLLDFMRALKPTKSQEDGKSVKKKCSQTVFFLVPFL